MSYSEDKFVLISKMKNFILESEILFQNIPRRDLYNRDSLRKDMTEILRLIYLANNIRNDKQLKIKYQLDICSRLSMLDFYLERAFIFEYINDKQLYTYSKNLEEIIKITKGWMKKSE